MRKRFFGRRSRIRTARYMKRRFRVPVGFRRSHIKARRRARRM